MPPVQDQETTTADTNADTKNQLLHRIAAAKMIKWSGNWQTLPAYLKYTKCILKIESKTFKNEDYSNFKAECGMRLGTIHRALSAFENVSKDIEKKKFFPSASKIVRNFSRSKKRLIRDIRAITKEFTILEKSIESKISISSTNNEQQETNSEADTKSKREIITDQIKHILHNRLEDFLETCYNSVGVEYYESEQRHIDTGCFIHHSFWTKYNPIDKMPPLIIGNYHKNLYHEERIDSGSVRYRNYIQRKHGKGIQSLADDITNKEYISPVIANLKEIHKNVDLRSETTTMQNYELVFGSSQNYDRNNSWHKEMADCRLALSEMENTAHKDKISTKWSARSVVMTIIVAILLAIDIYQPSYHIHKEPVIFEYQNQQKPVLSKNTFGLKIDSTEFLASP